MPKIRINDSPSPEVTLTPFSPSVFPVFKNAFDQRTADLAAAAFVVSNESQKAITGIGVKWTLIDSAGRESTYNNRTHSFLSPSSRPLALAHGRLLAGPETFVSEAILLHPEGGVIGLIPNDRTVARFSSLAEIRVEVDCIIFQDGEVAGPDELGLVDMIRDRREASEKVVKRVEQTQASGKDPAETLRQIVATPISKGDQVAKLEIVLAGELLRARRFDSHLRYLKGIPAPPLFFRNDRGPL